VPARPGLFNKSDSAVHLNASGGDLNRVFSAPSFHYGRQEIPQGLTLAALVESAKANGIDPYCYLLWLFYKLPLANTADDYDALLPWNMPM
jgi:IS66 C-terminal element